VAAGKCPWFPDGKHRNGCGCGTVAPSAREAARRGKQAQAYEAAKDKDAANARKKAEDYVNRNGNRKFDTKYQAGSHGIPPGVHMEKRTDGFYYVVLD
jgi:hypothetical protein